jgi:hypothetical protein
MREPAQEKRRAALLANEQLTRNEQVSGSSPLVGSPKIPLLSEVLSARPAALGSLVWRARVISGSWQTDDSKAANGA